MLITLIALLLNVPPSFASPPPSSPVQIHHNWGGLSEVRQYGRFFVSASPDEHALETFKNLQGGVVIDLRGLQEMNCAARTAAAKLGVDFLNIPLDVSPRDPAPIMPQSIATVEKQIEAAGTKNILITCTTGNRAALVTALHLAHLENLSPQETIERARLLGMTSRPLEAKLRSYLRRANLKR